MLLAQVKPKSLDRHETLGSPQLIDRVGRDRLSLSLRRLADGQSTNDDYETEYPARSSDAAIEAVSWAGWTLYSDFWRYRLRGKHALSPETRTAVARCIVFLDSNLEYEWPKHPRPRLLASIASLLTLGRLNPNREAVSTWQKNGDFDVWPFLRRSDYEVAVANPRFLAGA